MMRSTRFFSVIGLAATLALTACAPWPGSNLLPAPASTSTSTPPTTTPGGSPRIWALGDSQGAQYTTAERGQPWTALIGDNVGNGAHTMWGAGWLRPATHVHRTVPQRAADLAATYEIDEFVAMVGVNDLGEWRTTAEMLVGVDALEAVAAAEGARVHYIAVVPFPQHAQIAVREGERRLFNAALAQRYPDRFVDCSPTMATPTGWLRPDYSISAADLHLNAAGQQALAACINASR